ncbi:MAG: thiamine-phosphate kinase [Hyphomicrobium sp.]
MKRISVVSDRISNETELIAAYLAPLAAAYPGAFGLKDDAALISLDPGFDLVVSTDPVIAGVHFFGDDDPRDIAWKALAVNASDLAAKGAQPVAYTMALALPDAPLKGWMAAFSAGLAEAQAAFGFHLIGGDTDRTPGPLSISVTAFGRVPKGRFVRRQGARVGDHVFVSGTLGDASLGLRLRRAGDAFGAGFSQAHALHLLGRYLRPQPRQELATVLHTYASAALDVSDGLLKDAARLAAGGNAGLRIAVADLPLSAAARAVIERQRAALASVVSGGDDYEILFAVPANSAAEVVRVCAGIGLRITWLGELAAGSGVSLIGADGGPHHVSGAGYDHFEGN